MKCRGDHGLMCLAGWGFGAMWGGLGGLSWALGFWMGNRGYVVRMRGFDECTPGHLFDYVYLDVLLDRCFPFQSPPGLDCFSSPLIHFYLVLFHLPLIAFD